MISVCIVAHNRDEMLARTLPTVHAAAEAAGQPCMVTVYDSGPLPFSLGAWRTLAADAAKGDTIVILDADMLVPPDYLATLARVVSQGRAAFPLYVRERKPGGERYGGAGWGNAAFSRDLWERAKALSGGQPYGESTTWGGEDGLFVRLIQRNRLARIWRELVPGFVHLWHPKNGSPWYDQAGKGKS